MSLFLRAMHKFRSLCRTMRFRGIRIPVDGDHITYVNYKYLWRGAYEKPEINALLAMARPGDRVLELGTGMGLVSGVVAKAIPDLEIETYGANPGPVDNIKRLHKMNSFTNITAHNAILLPTDDLTPIRLNLKEHFTESTILDDLESNSSVEVPVRDMRKVLAGFRPDILVCDIEGGEEALFDGITLDGLRALVIEFHPRLISRAATKRIYDLCAAAGLYPRIDLSSALVVAFERVDA